MTDNEAEIARQLTTGEVEALRKFEHGCATWAEQERLISLGLLIPVDVADNAYTPLGRDVLAVLAALQPATDNKPTEITAAQFVSEGYAGKVARGECEVRWDTSFKVTLIEEGADDGWWDIHVTDIFNRNAVFVTYKDLAQFTVRWLQPALEADPALPAGEAAAGEVEYTDPFSNRYVTVEHLLTKIDTLRDRVRDEELKNSELESRLRQAEAVLRFYADEANYMSYQMNEAEWLSPVDNDYGKRAAAALARESEDTK